MSNAPGPAPEARRRVVERPQRRALALTPRPILTLDTIAPQRPTIRVDGLDYRLPLYEDFSLWQHARLAKLSARAGELDALALADGQEEPSLDDWAELDRVSLELYGEMVAVLIPDLPAPTRQALALPQRQAIVREFFAHNQSSSVEAEAATAPPTGGSSSPPSPAPTATGPGGRGKRRSASSSPPTAP
jgi:hypothetical protein